MQYSSALGAVLASFFTAILAQTSGFDPIISPKAGQRLQAGQNFDIVWQPSGAPNGATVTIKLLQGETPQTLQVGPSVGSHIPNDAGHYSWAVPQSLGSHQTYGFVLSLDSNPEIFQYSFPFAVDGTGENTDDAPTKNHGESEDGEEDEDEDEDDHDHGNDDGDNDYDDDEHKDNADPIHPSIHEVTYPTSASSAIAYPTGDYSYYNSTERYVTPTAGRASPTIQTSYYPAPTASPPTYPSPPPQNEPKTLREATVPASDATLVSWNKIAILGALAMSSFFMLI